MQKIEFKVSMVAINGCFNECIKQFKEDTLTPSEQQCLTYCAQRNAAAFAAMNDFKGPTGSMQF
jgi:uncharacterized protein YuzB (UPF0349 family)